MSNSSQKRINLGRIQDRAEIPHFLDYQITSYEDFLQSSVKPSQRENKGLERILREFFPIVSSYGNVKLEYVEYKLEEPEFPLNSQAECRKRSKTYSISLKAKLRVVNAEGEKIQEAWSYICDLPFMTSKGTFIVNGTERVVVAQLHRSPGVFFSRETNMQSGKEIFNGKIIPYKGTWLEIETTKDDLLQVRIDRRKKISFTIFVKALGFFEDNFQIVKEFFDKKKVEISDWKEARGELIGSFLGEDVEDENTGEVLAERGLYIDKERFDFISSKSLRSLSVYSPSVENEPLSNTLIVDHTKNRKEAATELFKKIRSSDIATSEGVKTFIKNTFFNSDRYNLGDVGRYKLNKRLGLGVDEDQVTLTKEDILTITRYVLDLKNNKGNLDDINSLSNRRIRGVGELMGVQLRTGLVKIERNAKEKMSMSDPYTVSIQSLLNTKFLQSIIMDFFASGQLSQFMDQTNPLSELTHKRRISSLGPGGLSKERATFEVRDIHSSHYGRLCPVETPEGQNIGLILSLASFARINRYGFIETPYVRVKDGKIQFNKVDYLNYDDEKNHFIAQIGTSVDEEGNILEEQVLCRSAADDEIIRVPREKVDYIDVSSKQAVSVSSSMIPFLENTDANRALTGSNMQRQAVPLIATERPYVGTGMEEKVARDSYAVITARDSGKVKYVDASKIIIDHSKGKLSEYKLDNFVRSNHSMCMTHKPLVNIGDKVEKGQVIADGPSTSHGEMSIGKNVMIAFMPWMGYNFEDAILISERLVKDDVFSSIHIEEYDVEVRSTKLGDEITTRELPNAPEGAIKDLDENGIVRIGAEVKSGSILVGKITPKSDVEPSAEMKLLKAIFGEKAKDVRDTSLKMPHGSKGTVVDIVELDRNRGDDLPSGVTKIVRVYVAEKRKITVGDKMCGRHGNKGIVSRILPVEDMPYLPDGRPVDVVLNPLSVPSRMNIGQVLEAHLGMGASELGLHVSTPVFDGATEEKIREYLKKSNFSEDGKTVLYDGRTGKPFDNRVTVGYMYMLKLHHLVEDKMHARAIGPYSLVTQQPLGGKAQFGGQRLGEMEVWVLEAYGASSILREMLTIKSDDVVGRTKAYEAIVKGGPMPEPSAPESFKVLIREFNSLGLDVDIFDKEGKRMPIDGDKQSPDDAKEFSMSYLNNDEENS